MAGFYAHYVEADGSMRWEGAAGEDRAGGSDEAALFVNVDRLFWGSESAGGPRPDLDEAEGVSVEGQEIDFGVAQVQVPGQDPVPVVAQMFLCDGFRVAPLRAGAPLAGSTVHRRALPERGDGP